ncbi:hypothetical protein R3W88_033062 [Solanum pinnatisectum]|uniref:Uncharacterized protein n=1 Tax=Solanum pinnatisectum TaxID=50273 RepID=A0AAV9K2H1_9SOLN|nr:hypothetical protein R3W88_033062 [Solanum pinnatisectum]
MNLNTKTSRDVPNIDRIASFPAASAGHSSHIDVVHPAETTTRHEEAKLIEKSIWKEQHAKDQHTKNRTLENLSEETESSNLSFGIKNNSMNITPTHISCVMQDTNQDKDMEKFGHDQQQRSEQTWQNQQAKGKELQTGHHKHKEGQKEKVKDTNQQGETSKLQQDSNRVQKDYQNNLPRISNNFTRYDPKLLRNKKGENCVQDNGKSEINNSSQAQQQMSSRRQYRQNEIQGQFQENNQLTGQQQNSKLQQHNQ